MLDVCALTPRPSSNEFAKTLDRLRRKQFILHRTKYDLLRDLSLQMKAHRACRLTTMHVGAASIVGTVSAAITV